LYQVLNFYSQHWPDPVQEVVVSAAGLEKDVERVVKENFALTVRPLDLSIEQRVDPEWYIALGSSLRGLMSRGADTEISLLGVGAREEFRREQLLNFIRFWRVMTPLVLGVLLVAFVGADVFLVNIRRSLESQTVFQLKEPDIAAIDALETEVQQFNKSVAYLTTATQSIKPKQPVAQKIISLADASGVTLNRIHMQGASAPVAVSGGAKSEDQILNFKKALDSDPLFTNVQLPLTDIKSGVGAPLVFSVSFSLNL
jgi:Tfp pilus assembly protein PilN